MGQGIQMGRNFRFGEINHHAVTVDQFAPLVNGGDLKIGQIFHNRKVSQESGGDGTPVVHQEVPGGMEGGDLHGADGIGTHADRFPADVIHVAFFKQVTGVLVISAEHTPVEVVGGFDQINQSFQIPGGGALPDHDELAQFQLVQGIFHVCALVIGVNTGGNIGIQFLAGEAGGVTVDFFVVGLGSDDFGYGRAVATDNTGEIHHLR